ncbi:serine protease [Crocinitomicaceae bacterium]|nr:serine protease [Crocinitomicaceae bacterium]
MKIILLFLSLFLSVSLFGQDATKVYNQTIMSTVTIETDRAMGSGFFVAPNTVVTNYHVIEGASFANCYVNNSKNKFIIDGYVAVDKFNDLILLNVPNISRPSIPFSNKNVSPGQQIYSIGSPKGLPATISDGIVSGLRDFGGKKLIQMTAPISPGSSGGPVLNESGELVGIAVSQLNEGQNINFAIPKSRLELLLYYKKEQVTPFRRDVHNQQNNIVRKEPMKKSKKVLLTVAAIGVGLLSIYAGYALGMALYY